MFILQNNWTGGNKIIEKREVRKYFISNFADTVDLEINKEA